MELNNLRKKNIIRVVFLLLCIDIFLGSCQSENVTTLAFIQTQLPSFNKKTIPAVTQVATETKKLISTMIPTAESTSTPAPQIITQQLTFVSDRHYGYEGLYAIDVLCQEPESKCYGEPKLLFEQAVKFEQFKQIGNIDWSPDGKRVAYKSNHDIYISDWNGKNSIKIEISQDGVEDAPRWSPDGSKVAFIYASPDEYPSIKVYNLASEKIETILQKAVMPDWVDWLPEGKMAYVGNRRSLYILNKNGEIIWRFPDEQSEEYLGFLRFDFTKDGQIVAFSGEVEPLSSSINIYLLDINKKNMVNITNGQDYFNFAPVWSQTDNCLAFMSNKNGDYEIYTIEPDGSNLLQITDNEYDDLDPAWRNIP